MHRHLLSVFSIGFFTLMFAAAADAQATRTWISGVGDDVNPCSRTAPCKTFAGAISKTAANGEINCLDSGGFGAVTITKSITLDCRQVIGGVLAAGTNGITINGSAVVVRLRGLDINGAATGQNGIRVINADKVYVEDSVIDGFIMNGVSLENTAKVRVFINNCTLRNNAGTAVGGVPTGKASVWISNSQLTGNQIALQAGANTSISISGNSIAFNVNGLTTQTGGTITSFKNNSIGSNDTNGAPTTTSIQQ